MSTPWQKQYHTINFQSFVSHLSMIMYLFMLNKGNLEVQLIFTYIDRLIIGHHNWQDNLWNMLVKYCTKWSLQFSSFSFQVEACCKKVSFEIFSLSYERRISGREPAYPSFWHDTDYRFVICSLHRLYCIVRAIPKDWRGPAGQSFFLYDKQGQILKDVVFLQHAAQ